VTQRGPPARLRGIDRLEDRPQSDVALREAKSYACQPVVGLELSEHGLNLVPLQIPTLDGCLDAAYRARPRLVEDGGARRCVPHSLQPTYGSATDTDPGGRLTVADVALNEDRLLTADELAVFLNVKPRWVRLHTTNNDLPHFRLGRYPRYRLSRVLEWLEDQERGGALTSRRSRRTS
jgi:hypothetical protein